MQFHRLFFYLRRINTLLPTALALTMAAALGWAYVADKRTSTRQTVIPPAGTAVAASGTRVPAQAVALDIRSSNIEVGPHTLVMKIVAPKADGGSYEGERHETRNLLFLSDGADKAHWLFTGASQAITELEALHTEAKAPLALYLETVPRPHQASNPQSAQTSAYLVSPDGLRKRAIASDLDHILSHRQHSQMLQLVYQKGNEVRVMRVSLSSFETLSDRVVATLSEVGK